ncbi:MAG: hypothetical protein AAF577_11485 [Pseudomonadota bacterium]
MTVIPFDPTRRDQADTAPGRLPFRQDGEGAATPQSANSHGSLAGGGRARSATAALAIAEAKVATLERTLLKTLRENARNRLRAEQAEAALKRLGVDPSDLTDPAGLR